MFFFHIPPTFHLIINFERWVLTKWNYYAEGKSSFKIIKTFPTKVVREGYYQGLELSGKCFYASISTLSGFMQKSIWIYKSSTRKVIWRRRKDILVRNLVHEVVSAWPNEVVRCSEVVPWGHLRRMEKGNRIEKLEMSIASAPPLSDWSLFSLWKWKSIVKVEVNWISRISRTDPFSHRYSEMSIVKVNCEQQCGDILVIKHTETASEFSFIKSVEWLNNWSWQMEVGTVAVQMRNSSASELTSVTLEHWKSQSAQLLKIYPISIWYFKNIAIAQKHNSRWEASIWWKGIQLKTRWCFKKCLCVATFNFCLNNCSSTSLCKKNENKGRAIKSCKQFLELQIFAKTDPDFVNQICMLLLQFCDISNTVVFSPPQKSLGLRSVNMLNLM